MTPGIAEKTLDLIPHVKSFFSSLVRAPLSFAQRIIDVPYQAFAALAPDYSIALHSRIGLLKLEAEEVTEDSFTADFFETIDCDLPEKYLKQMGDRPKERL